METPEGDPYAALGVARDATGPEIRKAYLRLVREHPPESDAEAFATISAAYAILGNPEKRAKFDAAIAWPADAREAADQAAALAREEKFTAACELLAPVVRRHPQLVELGRMEIQLLLGAKRFAEVRERCRRLVAADPNDAGAAFWLACAEGNDKEHGDPEEAERLLKHAVVLDPDEEEFSIALGRALVRRGRAAEAVLAIERALARPALAGPARLALLAELLRVTVFAPGPLAPDQALARLKEPFAAADDAVKTHVCRCIWRHAGDFETEDRPDAAAVLIEALSELAPENEDLGPIAERLRRAAAAREERLRFLADASRPAWLRDLVAALYSGDADLRRRGCRAAVRAIADSKRGFSSHEQDVKSTRQAFPRLIEHVDYGISGVLLAARFARPFPGFVALFCDPDVEGWIKQLVSTAPEMAGPESATFRAELGALLRGMNETVLRAQFAEACGVHGEKLERFRAALEALLGVQPVAVRSVRRAPLAARRKASRRWIVPVALILFLVVTNYLRVVYRDGLSNDERLKTPPAASPASAKRFPRNFRIRIENDGSMTALNDETRAFLAGMSEAERANLMAKWRTMQATKAEDAKGEGR